MSGICGFTNLNGDRASHTAIENMHAAIAHRGPNHHGVYAEDATALAHRRTPIIDASENAHQPMTGGDGNYVLVYDGSVYNFPELRAELESKGYRHRSQSDAEVVLNAYIEWGTDCLRRFNGMFAFVIYDKCANQLFCARDRYGGKPFYYALLKKSFVFASEQKAIYEHPDFSHQLDLDGVLEYFTFQNILTDRTFEKTIKVLPAGHFLVVSLPEGSLSIRQYWDFHFAQEQDRGEEYYAEKLDSLLEQAVKRQMVGNAEIGAFLSGGMDSGTITCIASRMQPHIKTFTCGYDMCGASESEMRFDERYKTEIMARAFQTEHYEMVLQYSDIGRAIPQICWHNEEPRVGQTYTNYYISQLASKFVKVAFSGTGGDELFGGYPWRYYRGMTSKNFDEFVDSYYGFWQRLIPTRLLAESFSPLKGKTTADPKQIFRDIFKPHQNPLLTPEDYINHALYFETKTFLPGMLFVEEKLSMAHGLESRMPMLDNDLADFAQRLPVKYKLNDLAQSIEQVRKDPRIKSEDYYMVTNLGKYLLRKTMEKYIPETIDRADKQGFSAPDASWFRNECRPLVDNVVYNNNARLWEYLSPKVIRSLVDQHMDGSANRRLLIWSLLNFEELLHTWF